jgi:hypothetical protein
MLLLINLGRQKPKIEDDHDVRLSWFSLSETTFCIIFNSRAGFALVTGAVPVINTVFLFQNRSLEASWSLDAAFHLQQGLELWLS